MRKCLSTIDPERVFEEAERMLALGRPEEYCSAIPGVDPRKDLEEKN